MVSSRYNNNGPAAFVYVPSAIVINYRATFRVTSPPMARVPLIGRLFWREYIALVGSLVLIFLETLIRIITLGLPQPVIRFCYKRSKNLFNSLSSTQATHSRIVQESIVSSIASSSDFVDLCALFGYNAEEHIVQTRDGYLLGLHRLCTKKGEDGTRVNAGEGTVQKRVVYLHHGLLMNSEVWVCMTDEERCLPFVLVEKGYDVWVRNFDIPLILLKVFKSLLFVVDCDVYIALILLKHSQSLPLFLDSNFCMPLVLLRYTQNRLFVMDRSVYIILIPLKNSKNLTLFMGSNFYMPLILLRHPQNRLFVIDSIMVLEFPTLTLIAGQQPRQQIQQEVNTVFASVERLLGLLHGSICIP